MEDVTVDDHHVSELAGLDGAHQILAAVGVGHIFAVHAHRIIHGYLLVGMIAAHGISVHILTGHGGVDAHPGIEALHRRIGAAGHNQPRIQIRLPEIAQRGTLLAHAILDPVQIGHQECGLDIQHKGQLLHALDQLRRSHLGMDETEGEAFGLLLRRHAVLQSLLQAVLYRVQGDLQCLVADAVGGGLQTVAVCLVHSLGQILGTDDQNTGVAGIVHVVGVQLGGTGTQRAVREALEASHPRGAVGIAPLLGRQVLRIEHIVQTHGHTHRQLAAVAAGHIVRKILVIVPYRRGIGVHHGHTQTGGQRQPLFHALLAGGGHQKRIGDQVVVDFGGLLTENAVGSAVGIQLHHAAGAEYIAVGDVGLFQRHRIGHRRMQAYALDNDGMLGAGLIQIQTGGQLVLAVLPLGLVKVGALDPLSLGRLRRAVTQQLQCFVTGGGAAQIHGGIGLAEGEEVQVGVAHTGQHGLALQIDALRAVKVLQRLLLRAHVGKFAVLQHYRVLADIRRLHRVDLATIEQRISSGLHFVHLSNFNMT